MKRENIYFLSDFHFGVPNFEDSQKREKMIVELLLEISKDAKAIFLLGDVFDFWYEYRHVVPKGYSRFLGTLALIGDMGVDIHYFCGNHDQWLGDYFEKEIGMKIHFKEAEFEFNNKIFYLGHGDGLDKSDRKYLILKSIFTNKILRKLFSAIHPYFAFSLAKFWSKHSRLAHNGSDQIDLGKEEPLVKFCENMLTKRHIDYFILGHRHLKAQYTLSTGAIYTNLGEMVNGRSYGHWDGKEFHLKEIKKD